MDQTLDQDRIIKINIEEEMKSSYIDYSMSVIVARALPDVVSSPYTAVFCMVCWELATRAISHIRSARAW